MRFVFVSFLLVLGLIEFQPKKLQLKKCAVVLDFHIGLWSYDFLGDGPSTMKLQLCGVRWINHQLPNNRLGNKVRVQDEAGRVAA
jgi:hypothetical protein